MSTLTFRNRLGELVDVPRIPASRAKNEFSSLLDQASRGDAVAITRHDMPKAVLLSFADFESLIRTRAASIDQLEGEFDALLAGMQAPRAKLGLAAAFDATPAQLGRAAVAAARGPVLKKNSATKARAGARRR